jgi:predicted benzoate:H+ symporter BenE
MRKTNVQASVSMFRSGRTGVALLIIRLCLVGTLSLHAYRSGPIASPFFSASILVLIASALAVGATTVIACFLYCAAEIAFMLCANHFDIAVVILSIPVAIALALLGPGAYSLDARIFGRRVIVLSPDEKPDMSRN